MAENIVADSGNGLGVTLAADEILSVHYPRTKLIIGNDGTNDGDVSASNPMPVDLGTNNDVTVTSGAITETNSTAILADTAAINAKMVSGTIIGDVNVIGTVPVSGSVTVDMGANNDVTVTSGAITETNSAAIKTAVELIDNAISGTEMRVDVVAALPTGANTIGNVGLVAGTAGIGKLTANNGVDIGDVDVTSLPQPTLFYRDIDANAEAAIKGSAGTLFWIHVMNLTAAKAYVHLYNATTASVTPGTTTPELTFPIGTPGDTNGSGFTLNFGAGQSFSTAITIVVTTTIDGSTGDPGTNGVFVNAGYT